MDCRGKEKMIQECCSVTATWFEYLSTLLNSCLFMCWNSFLATLDFHSIPMGCIQTAKEEQSAPKKAEEKGFREVLFIWIGLLKMKWIFNWYLAPGNSALQPCVSRGTQTPHWPPPADVMSVPHLQWVLWEAWGVLWWRAGISHASASAA